MEASLYKGHRYPVEIISHCVWLYHRFALSLRDISEMMLERGVVVSHETIRRWCAKFGQDFANQLRRRRPRPGDKWHLDEVVIRMNGTQHYLWRAVDQDGNVLDVLVQSRRNAVAAKKFFRKLLKRQCAVPRVLVTDKLGSYQVAHREVMPSVEHRRSRYLNNRAENSHQPAATRAGDETVRLARSGAAVPLGVRRHRRTLSGSATPAHRVRMATRDDRPIGRVERGHRCLCRSLNDATPTGPSLGLILPDPALGPAKLTMPSARWGALSRRRAGHMRRSSDPVIRHSVRDQPCYQSGTTVVAFGYEYTDCGAVAG
ncbi:transposase [Rhodococcus opacus RKJ300 = JCM 13270]|jgi:transposase-like protein|nr:transposase [Rhodococcus opacus RKJ300 = JCM 13270]